MILEVDIVRESKLFVEFIKVWSFKEVVLYEIFMKFGEKKDVFGFLLFVYSF